MMTSLGQVRKKQRMTLSRLFAVAGWGNPGADWVPRAWLKQGRTTPAVRQPTVRDDGVIEAPVPRQIVRALRGRG